jgi:hypothetical protein
MVMTNNSTWKVGYKAPGQVGMRVGHRRWESCKEDEGQ